MFKLKKSNTFKARVSVTLPGDTPDKQVAGTFITEYKHYNRTEFEALLERGLNDGEFIGETVTGFDELVGEDDKPLPFAEAKALVIADLAISAAVVRGFVETLAGAAAKNGKTSRLR